MPAMATGVVEGFPLQRAPRRGKELRQSRHNARGSRVELLTSQLLARADEVIE
jgi:hypothetical protein